MKKLLDILRFNDYAMYRFFHGAIHNRPYLNDFYLFFAKYGIIFFVLSFTYLIWKRKINAFFCAFLAMAYAGTLDILILLFWKRPRPFVTHSDEILKPITEGLRVYSFSFPSAHTYMAFAIATSVWLYGHRKLGIFLYILAIFVAIGRLGAGLHYPSDIIAGAFLGIASGFLAFNTIKRYEHLWRE